MDKLNRRLYKLEYKYGRFTIHNLMAYICMTTLAVFLLQAVVNLPVMGYLTLSRSAVFHGQIWRLITFIFIPPSASPVWLIFALYFYYFIGNSLEQHWGAFKFNIYYLCGIIMAIAAAMISGYGNVTYLNLSLFLAFAQLFPDTEFLLFFFLPIKAKYLGYFDWALLGLQLLLGSWSTKVAVLFAIGNFMLFFGQDFIDGLRRRRYYNNTTRVNFRKAMRDRERNERR